MGLTLTDIEDMIPFEREIYTSLLIKSIKDKQEQSR